jgi:hypothetical protein
MCDCAAMPATAFGFLIQQNPDLGRRSHFSQHSRAKGFYNLTDAELTRCIRPHHESKTEAI